MQTFTPTLRLGRDVWDRTAMPVEEFLDRAGRLRLAMREAGLDAMLLYGRGLNGCGHPTYVANYIVKLPFAALVVLPREGEPALIFEGATRGRDAAKATTWIDDVRPCWNLAEACLEVLAERDLLAKAIGLAGMPRLVPYREWQTLAAGLEPATLVDAEWLVDRQRAVKSPRELAQIHRASGIADVAWSALTANRAAATTEAGLAAEVIRAARMAGAEDIRLMIGRPVDREWTFRPPEARRLDDGDSLWVHLAVSWERYWSGAVRTFRARPSGVEHVWTSDLDARFERMVAAVRPGATVRDAVAEMRSLLTPAEWQALEVCGPGNGIGVLPEESPALSNGCDDILMPGMCLAVRAALHAGDIVAMHGRTITL